LSNTVVSISSIMLDILKLTSALVFMVFLLRKRWNVGGVMFLSSLVLITLYLLPPQEILNVFRNTLTSGITWELMIALTFIRFLEVILRRARILARMMTTMKAVLRSRMAVIISMPLLIGMLPSVGGAYFSAPMVDEATRDTDLSPEEKTFLNYWYRHPWELILPLYPGIILATLLTSVNLGEYILLNLPAALTMVITGFFIIRRTGPESEQRERPPERFYLDFLPIAGLFLLVIIFKVSLSIALVLTVLILLLALRYTPGEIGRLVSEGFSLNVIFLILGVIIFKETLEVSGAVTSLSDFFRSHSIPILPITFFLPFVTGLLTGLTVGFVSSSFPLLLSLLGNDPVSLSFAFTAGYIGVLISPVHVCLVLTREYFHADMMKSYRKILPAASAVFIVSLIQVLLLK